MYDACVHLHFNNDNQRSVAVQYLIKTKRHIYQPIDPTKWQLN